MRAALLGLAFVTASLLRASTATAQRPRVTAQFVAETGALVEILGLEHWTAAMLRDSLAIHAPGYSIASGTVAAALREKLGFPDAVMQSIPGDSGRNILLAVIEPQDSARVRRRMLGADTTRSLAPESWAPLLALAHTRVGLLEVDPSTSDAELDIWLLANAAQPVIYARLVGLPPALPLALQLDSAVVRRAWAVLATHRTTDDRATARRLLATSPNVYDRLAAVALLATFDQDDATWHALVGALLDPDERVRRLAHGLLRTFTSQVPRRVDWRLAVADLRAILDGGPLFAVRDVLDLLVATKIEPALAGPLLHDGGHAVLLFARATRPEIRRPSYRFLRTVRGAAGRGAPVEDWGAWIAELPR